MPQEFSSSDIECADDDIDRVFMKSCNARDANASHFGVVSENVLGRILPLPGSVRAIRLASRAEPPSAVMLYTDGHSDPSEFDDDDDDDERGKEDGKVTCGAKLEFFAIDDAKDHDKDIRAFPSSHSHLLHLIRYTGQFASPDCPILNMLADPKRSGVVTSELKLDDKVFERVAGCDPARWRNPDDGSSAFLMWHTGVDSTLFSKSVLVHDEALPQGKEHIMMVAIVLLTKEEWQMVKSQDAKGASYGNAARARIAELLRKTRGCKAQWCSLTRPSLVLDNMWTVDNVNCDGQVAATCRGLKRSGKDLSELGASKRKRS